jgi:hypothetical protein
MLNEPPVLNIRPRTNYNISTRIYTRVDASEDEDEEYGTNRNGFLDELGDSLQLTQTIFKDLLPLIQLDDYERPMIQLLREMVDSNRISAKDYEAYYQKFMLEAKQEMKKQVIIEKNRSIEKAQIDPSDKDEINERDDAREGGNEKLAMYATLLMPFWDIQPAVPVLFNTMLSSSDKQLKFATAQVMLRNGKALPDTLLTYFASLDDFRFDLYFYLKKIRQLDRFPAKYNNHVDIARSELLNVSTYSFPDTLVYLNRFPVQYKDRKGYIYFFKYRKKKDDKVWKIATAGLVPEQPGTYSFEVKKSYREEQDYDFSELTDTRIDEDEPLDEQLRKVLKKKLYSKRKSAARFYEEEDRYGSTRYFRD